MTAAPAEDAAAAVLAEGAGVGGDEGHELRAVEEQRPGGDDHQHDRRP